MRVSDNTSVGAVQEAVKRTRSKMEKLQIQNATQKRLLTPSDDPAANAKIMDIRTQTNVNSQYLANAENAKTRLTMTDAALSELYELFVRAKEIAIGQSSDASASADSRLGVAQELSALYKQLVAVANRRVGQHYLFGGFKTLTPPYTADGVYKGDEGEMPIEIQKGVFTAMNIPGKQVFEVKKYRPEDQAIAPGNTDKTDIRGLASTGAPKVEAGSAKEIQVYNIFKELDALRVGLLTNDTISIRDTLEPLDEIIKNVITIRTKVSSRVSGIDSALSATENMDIQNAELATKLEDADYAELWSNLAKEETVMRSSMQAAQKLIQPSLLDFLR